jgi:hypothetical protein
MSIVNIKRAFEKKLALLTPAIQTSYEGLSFTPTAGVPYQKVQLVPRRNDNPVLGVEFYRANGEFQVFLAYPTNQGTTTALSRAELIQKFFKRGTTLVEAGTEVLVYETPQIMGTTISGDRVVVPVIITYSVNVEGF